MTRMYTAGADLSGLIDTKEPLQITDVIHKAYIEINEEGTEGAATLGKFKTLLFISCNSLNCELSILNST